MARTRTEAEFAPSEEREQTTDNIFSNFLGLEVKVPYRDGRQLKVARGTLVSAAGDFVKIDGRLGIIIIHVRNIEKMSRLSEHDGHDSFPEGHDDGQSMPPYQGEERGMGRSRMAARMLPRMIPLRRGER